MTLGIPTASNCDSLDGAVDRVRVESSNPRTRAVEGFVRFGVEIAGVETPEVRR
jgi:hypothetical protein